MCKKYTASNYLESSVEGFSCGVRMLGKEFDEGESQTHKCIGCLKPCDIELYWKVAMYIGYL